MKKTATALLTLFMAAGCGPRQVAVDESDSRVSCTRPVYVYVDPAWGTGVLTREEIYFDSYGVPHSKGTRRQVRAGSSAECEALKGKRVHELYNDPTDSLVWGGGGR
jgi:hypothetical protein